jgi:hypothetical protein
MHAAHRAYLVLLDLITLKLGVFLYSKRIPCKFICMGGINVHFLHMLLSCYEVTQQYRYNTAQGYKMC